MPIPTKPDPTIQLLHVDPDGPFARFNPTADVTVAAAKKALVTLPKLPGGYDWPLWQLAWYFSAGTAKTATIVPHVRDADTGDWHALTSVSLMHSDATTSTEGQVYQFEVPAGHDAMALEITLTNADERPHISFRGAAWVTVHA